MGENPNGEQTPCAVQVYRFIDLATSISGLTPSCGRVRIVAIDGPGGAGKSTFAGRLSLALGGAQVIHADDFASWDNQFDWAHRLLAQVIEPLSAGRPGRYQRYDWVARRFAEWHDVAIAPVAIIEGVGAARREFATMLAFVTRCLADGAQHGGRAAKSAWRKPAFAAECSQL